MSINEYKLRRLLNEVLPTVTCDECPANRICIYNEDESYPNCVDNIINSIKENKDGH